MVYDYGYEDGKLVFERVGDQYEINYRYDENGDLFTFTRTNYLDNSRVLLYAVNNTRGDLIELRTGSGVIYAKYTYDSWGNLISVTDANGNALPATHAAHYNSIRYRGYVYDRETGLYYLQSRYYDAEVGRFLNADSVDYIGYSGEQLSYNAFAYCENDAVCYVDYYGYVKSYCVISKSASVSNIFKKAKKIFVGSKAFKMSYSNCYVLKNRKYVKVKYADYYFSDGYMFPDGSLFLNYLGATARCSNSWVVGYLGLMSVEDWYTYIAEKHKSFLTRVEEATLKRFGINEGNYEDFINALGETTGPAFIGPLLFFRNVIKVLESRMDKEDRYINSIIKDYGLKKVVLIVLKAEYYTYTSGKVMVIGGKYRWYEGWYLATTKYPY